MRLPVIMLCLAFIGCTISTNSSDVRNDIQLKAEGVKVKQAFLIFDENDKLVPEGNKVEVGQKVNLRLILEGWKATNGKVFLGASEKIATDEGNVMLDQQDLFAAYDQTGIDIKDAGGITLMAVITRVDRLFKHFEVSFKVWDKNSSDNVTGSYKLYLK